MFNSPTLGSVFRAERAYSSDEDLYRRNFNEDLYERDLDAELEARNLGGLIGHASSLASVAQAVAAFRQRYVPSSLGSIHRAKCEQCS